MDDSETKEEPNWPPMAAGFGVSRSMNHQHHMPSAKAPPNYLEKSTRTRNPEREICSFDEEDGMGQKSTLGKPDFEVGLEEEFDDEMMDLSVGGWKRDTKPMVGHGGYGASMRSPVGMQRTLSALRTSMWKGRSFDSTGNDGLSSSQSSSVSGNNGYQQQQYPSSGPAFDYSTPVNLDFGSGVQAGAETVAEPIGPGTNRAPGNLAGDPRWSGELCVERQAQAYRSAASGATAAAVWSGTLPPRNTKGSAFSCKVFLGGVPWDITEADLQASFGIFGNPKIEWPASHDQSSRNVKGHLYLIFDTEKSVKQLLGSCNYDFNQGHHNWYYKVSSKRMRVKEVQVIPWQLADASYVRNGCMTTFGTKTVFVGSLHGMLTAEGLAKVLDDLFQGVVAATIDTDKYKYPIGSGRVTFNSDASYMKALRAVFVDLRTPKFNKKIQIDPFLEDSACSVCSSQLGPYFCRDLQCFQYFCHACWQWQHSANNIGHHIPLMRNPRS